VEVAPLPAPALPSAQPSVTSVPTPTIPLPVAPVESVAIPTQFDTKREQEKPTPIPVAIPQPNTTLPEVNVEAVAPTLPTATVPPVSIPPTKFEGGGVPTSPALKTTPQPGVLTTAGSHTVQPLTAPRADEPAPKTDFDVDVVRVRNGDTYAAISERYYLTRAYAGSLKSFNGGADLNQLREVMVPPIHIIRKQSKGSDRSEQPLSREREDSFHEDRYVQPASGIRGPILENPVPTDTSETIDWGAPGRRRPTIRFEKYTTPREGMTARDVAKAVYDNDREWTKLSGPRGVRLRADDPLPRGTEITVPREELPWK
jgi:hypothetical protein